VEKKKKKKFGDIYTFIFPPFFLRFFSFWLFEPKNKWKKWKQKQTYEEENFKKMI